MRIIVLALLCVSVLLSGCFKSDTSCPYKPSTKTAPSAEEQMVANYLTTNSINATKHGSNLYYDVISTGAGGYPSQCSNVQIKYEGKLTNGNVFDSQENAIYTLGSLIEGWRIGMPLIQKGGRIKLYIPPSLAYGSTDLKDGSGNVIIPANSVLIFDITLKDFQ